MLDDLGRRLGHAYSTGSEAHGTEVHFLIHHTDPKPERSRRRYSALDQASGPDPGEGQPLA